MSAVAEDRKAILQLKPTVVRASAGTGKTYQLTARFLRILLQGVPPESVLATTFTRKAAGEILARVLEALAKAADEKDPESLNGLRAQVDLPTLPRAQCSRLARDLVFDIHRLKVSTLDSLFSTLARSLPFELGLPAGWNLTDEIEERWLVESAVNDLVASADLTELRSLLAMLSKGRVVRSVSNEIQRVVTDAYAIQRRCDPEVWSAVRVPRMPGTQNVESMLTDFRAADVPQKSLVKCLNKAADAAEQSQWDELAEETLLNNIVKARRSRTEVKFGRSKFPDQLNPSFDVLLESVRSHVLALLDAQNRATGTLVETFDQRIQQMKAARRRFSFDDVAVRLADYFGQFDSDRHDAIGNDRLDAPIDHLLLDEFQDTSPIQWAVLRPFAIHATSAESSDDDETRTARSFFCVGDTKQAIYGFRGGVAEIFDSVTDDLDGVRTVEQNESYRSSPVVLDFVTDVFKNLKASPPSGAQRDWDSDAFQADAVRRFREAFPPHVSAKPNLKGHVAIWAGDTPESADANPKKAQWKEACFDAAARVVTDLHLGSPDRTIGVLTRSRRAAAEMMWRLDGRGLTVSQEGGHPLTDSAAVELVLSALMMVEHPGDGRWQFHLMHSPLGDALCDGVADDQAIERIENRIRQSWTDGGLAETVFWLCDQLLDRCDASDALRLKQLTQLAASQAWVETGRLSDFVRLVREKGVERPQAANVRVMTVHASKGLEFDAVVLPDLDEPLTRRQGGCIADAPSVTEPATGLTRYVSKKRRHFLSQRWQAAFGRCEAGDMTEALCLLYVAMTRARQSLQLVVQPKEKRKSGSAKTAAGLILDALELGDVPASPEQPVFEVGNHQWWL
ncbi:UvrD-helicase domain-containing protein [Crateriforma conspicua]|uniref:UvrD-helicase domain-containing protein n=1 Tax=Crateriforma conspicua TaxID=2527996 RepID=UPI00118CA982|nr:UvrD-helicase domain-containing protein [Crateriforma conspicua]QDV65288.1 ATP-dependent helicase/nuclease subunit A [Crateriforma conspicua]